MFVHIVEFLLSVIGGKMFEPNEEQRLAIEHTGGISLKAGAGSGKTFVLVEHIVFLIEEFIVKNPIIDEAEFEKKFSLYISGIVLMTFTKKAAGELSIRLRNKIRDLSQERENKQWDIIYKNISKMTVGTIHSFCFKLLRGGHFVDIDPDLTLINELESKNKLTQIINNWLEFKLKDGDYAESIIEDIYASSERVIQSFCRIFSLPELRMVWRTLDVDEVVDKNINDEFIKTCQQISLGKIIFLENELSLLKEEFSNKKWFLMLSRLASCINGNIFKTSEDFTSLLSLFNEFKGARGPTKKDPESAILLWEEQKLFKKLINDNAPDFLQFFEDNTFCKKWMLALRDLYDYIELNYLSIKGITFSDLEYYVMLGLEDEETKNKIRKSYNYLIVDEFQDTSEVQFTILSRLINNDFNRMFCVGDIKQAIYGFRGGEVSLFQKFDFLAPQSLTLNNNFRSYKKIVEFNNSLFDYIFPLGQNYEGQDFFKVEGQNQNPISESTGEVIMLRPELSHLDNLNEFTLSSSEMSRIEAETIIKHLHQTADKSEKVCILYKKLTPLKFLVPLLIKNNLSFTAQIKIPFLEDPILGLYKTSLEYYLKNTVEIQEEEIIFSLFMLKGHLDILGFDFDQEQLLYAITKFSNNIPLLGVMNSFNSFIFSLGIATANYDNTLVLLESISNLAFDDPESILITINSESARQYSYDFQYGDTPTDIRIMTTHSSKGLEFDHVILAGIHTNGGRLSNNEMFGSIPGSFLWRNKKQSHKLFKTPFFIFENLLEKNKEFAENKRLLYVACTRAIKSLVWVNIENAKGPAIKDKNSWINALRKFVELKNFSVTELSIPINISGGTTDQSPAPLFHNDNVGVFTKSDKGQWGEELACFSEISVTRFTTIVDCPRKFYLKNICKLNGDEFSQINNAQNNIDENNFVKEQFESNGLEEESLIKPGAMERGSFIHEQIYRALTHELIIQNEINDKVDLIAIEYAINQFKDLGNISAIYAEEPIKFPMFGYMLSGTPDLVIEKINTSFEVWDFKTGKTRPANEESYWYQLYCYGYSLYSRGMIDQNAQLVFSLIYVDQQIKLSQELSISEISEKLFSAWKKLNEFDQVNLDHCDKCQYAGICGT